ncbi:lasso peptide biosynthesis B2 protein [Deinococcus aquiradiocola]|nr:lasso peptide biosynthesis B2 protein [Deinococcus aquiradiocola]
MNPRDARQIALFVQGDVSDAPPADQLRQHRLSALAFHRLDASHPTRAEVRADYRELVLRRQIVLAELRPLLDAWCAEGLQVMVFKGYHLAEYVYERPELRPYGDVDVLIRPEQAERASSTAQRLGYRVTWQASDSLEPHKHELLHLLSPSGQVVLDVHSRLLHNTLRGSARQQRITDAVWRQAVPVDRSGLLGPAPVDALLVGLILNRLWVPEQWVIKAQDLLDFRALVERAGVTEAQLWARARQFGCTQTVRQFLRRCDGFTNRIDLSAVTPTQRARWDVELLQERGSVTGEYALALAAKLPEVAVDVAAALPGVLYVLWLLRRTPDLPTLLRRVTPPTAAAREVPDRERQRLVRGVHLALTLLRVRPGGNCLPRSLALYRAYRLAGLPAVLTSGVRRSAQGIDSHAWVELHGAPINDPYAHENPGRYRVNLRYPLD